MPVSKLGLVSQCEGSRPWCVSDFEKLGFMVDLSLFFGVEVVHFQQISSHSLWLNLLSFIVLCISTLEEMTRTASCFVVLL